MLDAQTSEAIVDHPAISLEAAVILEVTPTADPEDAPMVSGERRLTTQAQVVHKSLAQVNPHFLDLR
jgi:hypothetical protein